MTLELRAALLADYCVVHPKPTLVGVFDVVIMQRVGTPFGPIPLPTHYLYVHLACASMDGSTHLVTLRLIDGDAQELHRYDMQIDMRTGVPSLGLFAYLCLGVRDISIPDFGGYEWEISGDGIRLGSSAFTVLDGAQHIAHTPLTRPGGGMGA